MKKIIYTKFSNERSIQYAIRTDILVDEDDKRYVRKSACYPEGEAHIQKIFRWYQMLEEQYKDTQINMNRCTIVDEGVELEYLYDDNLEMLIDIMLSNQEIEPAQKLLRDYLSCIQSIGSLEDFHLTQPFIEVFGEVNLPEGLKCATVTNIDMVLANCIVNDQWNIIDYEWTFEFPIPVNYVLYRVLHYYVNTGDNRKIVKKWGLFELLNIKPEEILQYEKMEAHFQKHIEKGHVAIRNLYEEITPGMLSVHEMIQQEHSRKRSGKLQIFWAKEKDFIEESSKSYPMKDGKIDIKFDVPEGTRKIRLDPSEQPGIMNLKKLKLNSVEDGICKHVTNGSMLDTRQVIFETQDPQILILEIPEGTMTLEAELEMVYTSEAGLLLIRQMYERGVVHEKKIRELQLSLTESQDSLAKSQDNLAKSQGNLVESQHSLAETQKQIFEIENTMVWKTYRKLRGINGKDK